MSLGWDSTGCIIEPNFSTCLTAMKFMTNAPAFWAAGLSFLVNYPLQEFVSSINEL